MNWVLDHLQLIIAIGGSVAWWLNKQRQAQKGGEEPRKEATFDDPELAERTRRIREEIQRKIEQRARGYANEQPTIPRDQQPPALPPPVRQVVANPPAPPPLPRASTARLEAQRSAEILEQQAIMMEQLRLAAEMKAAAQRRTEFESQVASEEKAAASRRGALVEDLRDPETLRRAFILREIIGPPLALR